MISFAGAVAADELVSELLELLLHAAMAAANAVIITKYFFNFIVFEVMKFVRQIY